MKVCYFPISGVIAVSIKLNYMHNDAYISICSLSQIECTLKAVLVYHNYIPFFSQIKPSIARHSIHAIGSPDLRPIEMSDLAPIQQVKANIFFINLQAN